MTAITCGVLVVAVAAITLGLGLVILTSLTDPMEPW